jgi:hypothetical protein
VTLTREEILAVPRSCCDAPFDVQLDERGGYLRLQCSVNPAHVRLLPADPAERDGEWYAALLRDTTP